MRKFKTDMGKNSQNVIISTGGMRNVMNIIKKKKKLQMVAINIIDVFTAVKQSHFAFASNGWSKKSRSCAVPAECG